MKTQITSLQKLNELISNAAEQDGGPLEVWIALNGGVRSSKAISEGNKKNTYYILNLIDDTEQELTTTELFDTSLSNIGHAMNNGALYTEVEEVRAIPTEKHSPGVWMVKPFSKNTLTIQTDLCRTDNRMKYIAEIKWERSHGGLTEEDYANAELIAAAPALKSAIDIIQTKLNNWQDKAESMMEDTDTQAEGYALQKLITDLTITVEQAKKVASYDTAIG